MKKLVSIVLAFALLIVPILPQTAFAASGTIPTVCNALGNNFVTIAYDSTSKAMDININKDKLTDEVKSTALAQRSGAGSYKGLAYEGVSFPAPEGATQVKVDGSDAEALTGGVYTQWYPVLYAVDPDTHVVIFPFDPENIIASQDKTLAEQLGSTPYELVTRIDAGRGLEGSMDLEWQDEAGGTISTETISFTYHEVGGAINYSVSADFPNGFVSTDYAAGSHTVYLNMNKDKLNQTVMDSALAQKPGDGSYKGLAYQAVKFNAPTNAVKIKMEEPAYWEYVTAEPVDPDSTYTQWFPVLYAVDDANVPVFPFTSENMISSQDQTLGQMLTGKDYHLVTREDAGRNCSVDYKIEWLNADDVVVSTQTYTFVYRNQGVYIPEGSTTVFGSDTYSVKPGEKLTMSATTQFPDMSWADPEMYEDGLITLDKPFDNDVVLSLKYGTTPIGTYNLAAGGTSFWVSEFINMTPRQPLNVQTSGAANTITIEAVIPASESAKTVAVTISAVAAAIGSFDNESDWTKVLASDTATVTVQALEHSAYTLSTGSVPTGLRVGQEADVDVTLAAAEIKDIGYSNVRVNVEVEGPGAAHLLAMDTAGHEYDVADVGYWGPAGGFPIAKDYTVTTPFSCSFEAAGEYTVTLSLVDMANSQAVIATKEITINVQPLEHSVYTLSTGSVPTGLAVGREADVDVTLAATEVKDIGYSNVRVNVEVEGPGAAHLIATDTTGHDYDVAAVGYWGPAGGFPIAKDYTVTTPFTCSFEAAGEYTITLSLVDMANSQAVIASKEITINVLQYSVYELSTGSVPTDLRVGQEADVNVTLAATEVKDLGYSNVRVNVEVEGPGAAHLLAMDTTGHEYDVADVGYWGPAGGFPVAKDYTVTTPFSCSFEAEGTYTITLNLVDIADGGKVIATKDITIDVQPLEHSVYALSTGSIPADLHVGQEADVDVTLSAAQVKDLGYSNVRVNVEVDGPGAAHLLATDTTGHEYDVADVGYWGPTGGFPIAKDYAVTTQFTSSFEAAGEYTITLSLVDMANSEAVITSIDLSVTVYCTVTFDSQGGSTVASVLASSTIAEPAAPTRTGYVFGGWYKDAACTDDWNFAADTVTGDVTLYAKWSAITYTVTFDAAGGKVTPSSKLVTFDGTYGDLPIPVKTGYYFFGWYTSNDKTRELIEADDIVKITADTTLYARWGANALLAISTPSLTAKAPDYKTVVLTWKAVAGAKGYEIYKKIAGRLTLIDTVDGVLTYTDTNVTAGTYYYYQIRAYHKPYLSNVYSGYSYIKSAKPLWPTLLLKAVSGGHDTIVLDWNDIAGADKYEVYRNTSYGGTYTRIGIADVSAYTDNVGLANGKTYYYKIRPFDQVGENNVYGPYSGYRYAKPLWPVLSLTAVSGGYDSIVLDWNDIAGADKYQVYRNTSYSGTYTLIDTVDVSAYTDDGLTAGKRYYYKIRPFDENESGPEYAPYSSYRYAKPVPSAPVNVALLRTSVISLIISWNAVEGASGYEVYRATSLNGTYYRVTTTNELGYEDIGLFVSRTYYYKVRTYTMVGTTKVYGPYSEKAHL